MGIDAPPPRITGFGAILVALIALPPLALIGYLIELLFRLAIG